MTQDTSAVAGHVAAYRAMGDTWRNIRHELDRMHLVILATADDQVHPLRSHPGQRAILQAPDRPDPPGSSPSLPSAG